LERPRQTVCAHELTDVRADRTSGFRPALRVTGIDISAASG
jgi:hypothetical protein